MKTSIVKGISISAAALGLALGLSVTSVQAAPSAPTISLKQTYLNYSGGV